jgi:hypothetical protein
MVFVVIGGAVGLALGFIAGFGVSTRMWSRAMEEKLVAGSLWRISSMNHLQRLVDDGQTNRAVGDIQVFLHFALDDVDLLSTTLHRPDMLTNSDVVSARSYEKR